jgi:glycerol-3-phosphate dehydrogenase (NAD(P)+)
MAGMTMAGRDHGGAAPRVCVAGAGAWGTALAILAGRAGLAVTILARSPAAAARIDAARESPRLPGRVLPPSIRVTGDPAEALAGAQMLLLVTPSQAVRAECERIAPHAAPDLVAILCAKGVERETGLLMSEVVAEALPGRPVAALSGPSFADEAADGLPTAVTIACADLDVARAAAAALGHGAFRPYAGADIIGVELGGACKNVIAIACGACEGLGLGANARAALIARGLAEIGALGAAMGADPATLAGLAGLGDLTLTCTSPKSRNMAFGIALGRAGGLAAPNMGANMAANMGANAASDPTPTLAAPTLAEGAENAASVTDLARTHGVTMPICEAVRAVLDRRIDLHCAIEGLLARPLRVE